MRCLLGVDRYCWSDGTRHVRRLPAVCVTCPWHALLAEQLLDGLGIALGQGAEAVDTAQPLARLVLVQVRPARLAVDDLARARRPEALLRPGVRLHLRHVDAAPHLCSSGPGGPDSFCCRCLVASCDPA